MFISTSKTRALYLRRPQGQFVLNKDSLQAQGLVGWWPCLGGNSTTHYDLSGNGFDGTIETNVASVNDPIRGPVLSFSGGFSIPPENVSIPNVLTNKFGTYSGDIAWFMWIYPTTILSTITIVDTTNGHLTFIGGTGTVGLGGSSGSYTSTITANEWQLVGASTSSVSNSVIYTWRNGIGTATGVTAGTTYTDSIDLGNTSSGGGIFAGYRSDFRIYKDVKGAFDVGTTGTSWQMYDPRTRWDLYYRIGTRTLFTSLVVSDYTYEANGSISLSGRSDVIDALSPIAGGRLILSGNINPTVNLTPISGGRLILSGVNDISASTFLPVAGGRLILSGINDISASTFLPTAGGRLILSGNVNYTVNLTPTASGSIILSGINDISASTFLPTAGGNLILSGNDTNTTISVSYNVEGRLTLSGIHDPSEYFNITGNTGRIIISGSFNYSMTFHYMNGGISLLGIFEVSFFNQPGGALKFTGSFDVNTTLIQPLFSVGGLDARQEIFVANNYNGQLGLGYRSDDASIYSNGVYPTVNNWYHVLFTRSFNTASLYLNNQLVNSATVNATVNYGTNQLLRFGGLTPGYAYAFMDEARFYNQVLNSRERGILSDGEELPNADWSVHLTVEMTGGIRFNGTYAQIYLEYEANGALTLVDDSTTFVAHLIYNPFGSLILSGSFDANISNYNIKPTGGLRLVGDHLLGKTYTANGKIKLTGSFHHYFVAPHGNGKIILTGEFDSEFLPSWASSGRLFLPKITRRASIIGTATIFSSPFIYGFGDIALTGTHTLVFLPNHIARGKIKLTGEFDYEIDFVNTNNLSGGITLKGVALIKSSIAQSSEGTFTISGHNDGKLNYINNQMIGGITLSGSFNMTTDVIAFFMVGTFHITGNTEYSYYMFNVGGNFHLSSNFSVSSNYTYSNYNSNGGLTLTGYHPVNFGYLTTGRLILTGQIDFTHGHIHQTNGRLVLSGQDTPTITTISQPTGKLKLTSGTRVNVVYSNYQAFGKLGLQGICFVDHQYGPLSLPFSENYAKFFRRNNACDFITKDDFYLLVDPEEPIYVVLTNNDWELICYDRRLQEGTIRVKGVTCVVKIDKFERR